MEAIQNFFFPVAVFSVASLVVLTSCTERPPTEADAPRAARPDPHSYARPAEVAVQHLALDLEVDFTARQLRGRASLTLERPAMAAPLRLDTRELDIEAVVLDADETPAAFALGEPDPWMGRELTVELEPGTRVVHIDYATRPGAAALQWLEPAQTATGEHPFLFTQSQAILARTWVPCQDSPGVRFTYEATVRVPPELLAVMSAENPVERRADGEYRFTMPQPIPSYLLALAVGELEFRALGERTGVYAEPPVVERAAWEFAETEAMIDAVEALYGPYRWGRYDLLVLPPSFPFGGMENPRLTFATPTILAGDRSLVSLVAHELAHSWSGNLVTNATWDDFWLNEGFTVYLERRIMEELYGRAHAEMEALLGRQDLERELAQLTPRDAHLRLQLAGRDPDEGMTQVAYEKGYLFLRRIEEAVGRERFDPFLRAWFDDHAFTSQTTADFVAELERQLIAGDGALAEQLAVASWIDAPGVPAQAPRPVSDAFEKVEGELAAWRAGKPLAELRTGSWTTQEWLHFLRSLSGETSAAELAQLDAAHAFTDSGNAEILSAWFELAIDQGYEPAYPALERFLTGMGRRKFLRPLYQKLSRTEAGMARAQAIYERARPTYHPLSVASIDAILGR